MVIFGTVGVIVWALFGFHGTADLVIGACAVVTLVFGISSVFMARAITVREGKITGVAFQIVPDEANLALEVERRAVLVTSTELDQFTAAMLTPKKMFTRISEGGRVVENYTSRVTTYTVSVASTVAQSSWTLPLHLKRRGELMDGLRIADERDVRISSLTHDEALVFTAAILRRISQLAGGTFAELYVRDFEPFILLLLNSQEPVPRRTIASLTSGFDGLISQATDERQVVVLTMLFKSLAMYNPVLIKINPLSQTGPQIRNGALASMAAHHSPDVESRRYKIEEKLLIHGERPSIGEGLIGLVRGRLRPLALVLFGVRDSVIFFPLANADRCQSYHFQGDGPDNAYLVSQRLSGWPSDEPYKMRPLEGQTFSHLYVRNATGVGQSYYQGRYHDVPPGSIGVAALAAFSALFALSILSIQHMRWTPVAGTSVNASLLLGLPALLIGYLGFGKASAFLVGSVSARVVTVVSLLTSLSAIVVTAVVPRASVYSTNRVAVDLATVGPVPSFWLTLIAIQSSAFLYALGVWFYRSSVYFGLANGVPTEIDPRFTVDEKSR